MSGLFADGEPVGRRPGSPGGPAAAGHGIKGALKDKRVQLAVAGAAVLGLFVLMRRGGAPGGGGDDGTTPKSMSPAVMDSSGTDVYNAIQSLGQGWENDLREYTATLTNVGTQVATNTSGLATNTSGLNSLTTAVGKLGTTKAPAATAKPPTVMPLNQSMKSGQGFGIITSGDTAATIANRYGITTAKLAQLNPGGLLSHFGVGEAVRVRAVAGPAPTNKSGISLWR